MTKFDYMVIGAALAIAFILNLIISKVFLDKPTPPPVVHCDRCEKI